MAKKSQNKFIKRQKELDRMQKAKEKMARRQGEKKKGQEPDISEDPILPQTIEDQHL